MSMPEDASPANGSPRGGLLDLIEKIGNRLPDPNSLFVIGLLLVMLASFVAATTGWKVETRLPTPVMETYTDADGVEHRRPKVDEAGDPIVEWRSVPITEDELVTAPKYGPDGAIITDPETGEEERVAELNEEGEPAYEKRDTGAVEVLEAKNLISTEGIYWLLKNLVANFMAFPPLGVVLVGMLGIGVAERTGLIGACLKAFMLVVPGTLLTPAMVFIGIMSSLAMDAGYVVLPPLAAALYQAVGRSPLAGLAAVFAGVSAGFNANLLITGLDPMLAGFSNTGGQVIDPDYQMNPACNWYFMIASTFVITAAGWATTSWFVERRLNRKPEEEGGPAAASSVDLTEHELKPHEVRGMKAALGALVVTLGIFFAMMFIPNAPLYGKGALFDRWVEVIVPMIFLSFVIPGIVYGFVTKELKNDKEVATVMMDAMKAMAPIIVLAFFAAQFIEAFKWSNLDKMLAMTGGQVLGQADMPVWSLLIAFIGVTMVFNLFVGSMSAKYAMFAPIFIPMFMMVGISPELTQSAYRIGDSVTNIITPLNAYLVIILVFMQKFVPKAGMGTLISTMLPYSIVFAIVWCIMLLIWVGLGIPLGPDGPLTYNPIQ